MDSKHFLADLERKPEVLDNLSQLIHSENPWDQFGITTRSEILFLGMGSSNFAASLFAARLRRNGVRAVAELASSNLLPPSSRNLTVIAVSAGGSSIETATAVENYSGRSKVIALTNASSSKIGNMANAIVELHAGPELGGVACRSFQHTLALLMALEVSLGFSKLDLLLDSMAKSTEATSDLLDRRGDWLPRLKNEVIVRGESIHLAAPADRLSSAQQGALMFREGPRIAATASEVGEWSHVDVYLTKSTDYRLLLFPGSRWEAQLFEWTKRRGSKVVVVGAEQPDADLVIRYRHDDHADVRLLSETLVAELLAASQWT